MSLQDTDINESGEDDSMARKPYAMEMPELAVLISVIQDMVQQKDDLPIQLSDVANAILETTSGLNSLKNHRKDFERLLGKASTSLVIFWQFYIEAKTKDVNWPPPDLKDLLDLLVDTTCGIHKLMGRKSEKKVIKRALLSRFGISNLGKFNKYQQKLDIVASGLQSKSHKINIHEILLAVVHSRAQPQDEDSDFELAGELVEGDFPDKKSAKKKAADKKTTAQGSRLREVGKSTTVKPANQRVKSEEDSQRKSSKAKNEAKDNSKHESEEECSAADKKPTAEGSRLVVRRLREVGESTTVKPASQRVKSEEDSQRKSSEDSDSELGEELRVVERDLPDKKSAKKKAADKIPTAEGSRLPVREVGESTTVKPANQRVNSEDQEDRVRSETMRYELDEAEGTSAQGSRSNNATQLKTRKRPSQAYEDEKNISLRDTAPKRKSRSQTNPVSPPLQTPRPPPRHQATTPGPGTHFSFTNGSGYQRNENIGNTHIG